MIKSNENNLSSSTNSNSYLDTEHDMHEIRFIDMLDENNNNHNHNESNNNKLQINNNNDQNNNNNNNNPHLHRNNHLHPQVKFVTHFSNIKEDEDDDKK